MIRQFEADFPQVELESNHSDTPIGRVELVYVL